MDKDKKESIRSTIVSAIAAACIVFCLTLALYKLRGFAPFGGASLACNDAYFQYLDFFRYMKDVLTGRNGVAYSFSNGLGKTNIGLWAYYLASPLNILLLGFEKSQMNAYLDIIAAVKMALCAGTMCLYLQTRYKRHIYNTIAILLSIGYAWSEYNWSQASNVMWLDGTWLLPLMLLAVYRLVWLDKKYFLSFVVAASILIQWYTAGINCLFISLWFFFELALYFTEKRLEFMPFARKFVSFGLSMMAGVFLSGVVFLPVILDLRGGKGTFDWQVFNLSLRGNPLDTFTHNVIGGVSTDSYVVLFCGSIVVLGCIGVFLSGEISKTKKTIMAAMFFVSLLMYYWQPFFLGFSLLKSADSYFYRYSYVTCAGLVIISGYFFALSEGRQRTRARVAVAGGIYAVLLLASYYIKIHEIPILIRWTVFFAFLTSVGVYLLSLQKNSLRYFGTGVLIIVTIAELSWNASELMSQFGISNSFQEDEYSAALENQLMQIKSSDIGFYRITQTSSKEMRHRYSNIAAVYTNALGFDYAGIGSYSSCPDQLTLTFLEQAGYRSEADCVTVVNTSILPLDSLLGVRYVLSPYDIMGCDLLQEANPVTELGIFRNPYAAPMAFAVKYRDCIGEYQNSFEYVNDIFRSLSDGKKTPVFEELDYVTEEKDHEIDYTITGISPESLVYGNIVRDSNEPSELEVNGYYRQGYSQWLSPSVFLLPVNADNAIVRQHVADSQLSGEGQFFKVNFQTLKESVEGFWKRAAQINYISDGSMKLHIEGTDEEMMFFSVPYNRGWKATVNGEHTPIQLLADAFIGVPLVNGSNDIELVYHVPGIGAGICFSVIGLMILMIVNRLEKRRII